MAPPIKIRLASRAYDGTLPILRGQKSIPGFEFEVTETEDVPGMFAGMQAQIEERVRPLAQLTLQAEVAQLRDQFARDQAALKESLARIDQCIVSCTDRLDEYQRRYADLTILNERIASLGAAPEPLPENLAARDVKEIIDLRLQNLSLTAKF